MDYKQAVKFARHIRFLKGVPDEGFDMQNWFSDIRSCLAKPEHPPKKQDASCGTAACVAGWLPAVFPQDWTAKKMRDFCGRQQLLPIRRRGTVRNNVFAAFAFYFGISYKHADDICDPMEYEVMSPPKEEVIDRMIEIGYGYGWDVAGPRVRKLGAALHPTPTRTEMERAID